MVGMNLLQKCWDWVYEQSLPEKPFDPQGVLCIAHRGFRDHPRYKENTLEAFRAAVELGAGLELDLRLAACGTPMVLHDRSAQRVFGIPLLLKDYSREQWSKLEPQIPSFAELLADLPQCPYWMIEIKNLGDARSNLALVRAVAQILAENPPAAPVCFLALDAELMDLIAAELGGYARSYVYLVAKSDAMRYLQRDPDCGLMGWYGNFPRDLLGRRSCGVGFVNYPWTASRLVSQGFSILFSDRVDRLMGPS